MKAITVLSLMTVLVGSNFVLPQVSQAEERICRGSIGSITVDNLKVPDGASCTLSGTRVQGSIVVGSNASLAGTNIRVIGNIQAENATRVNVGGTSSVGGSIQLKQGRAASIVGVTINGSLQMESNSGALSARSNKIGADLQAFQNTSGVVIQSNRIDGNLQCKENRPAPTGGGNVVQGNKEDQCARL
ncbi:hypothetical protein [Merismopedia glauca]|uniref:Filamentous hemagglutinin n=1 Tax=Merismopedia glauca CCAP 1448/3 TaxID=1296344 RepID=A0A2T1C8A1_9CYAN|nr:hypothetical protein [Merismopedia glauca]PSB04486.1 hypothetical protein C7B64_03440 [Merismopedia glauca CCAP 1448/3]